MIDKTDIETEKRIIIKYLLLMSCQENNTTFNSWIQVFQMMLQMFRTILADNSELSDEKINELVDAFMNAIPVLLKTQLQAA